MIELCVVDGVREITAVVFVTGDVLECSVVNSSSEIEDPIESLCSRDTEGELDGLRDFVAMLGFAMLVVSERTIKVATLLNLEFSSVVA